MQRFIHGRRALFPRRAARDGEREVAAARVDERMRGPATAAVSAGLILGTLWAANSAEAAGAAWEATHYHANVSRDAFVVSDVPGCCLDRWTAIQRRGLPGTRRSWLMLRTRRTFGPTSSRTCGTSSRYC